MNPAGIETGSIGLLPVVQGATVSSSGHTEVGRLVPGDLQQPCPSSQPHPGHPQKMEVQQTGAMAPCPVTQGNQVVGHQWVRIPSGVSGLSSIPPTPGSGQDGFIAEARGTCHAIDVAQGNPCVTGATASSSGHPSQATAPSAGSTSKRPLFKLAKYDGRTNVDTYLVQFKQLAEYLHWDEDDKFYNMCASLDGPAGLVLKELTLRTSDELEGLLQTKFGTGKQSVSFQAKLRARRRAEGEPLQDLYRDISRLVQLAHPTKSSHFWAYVGINAFVGALNDRDLEFEILKLEPKTLEDAFDNAVRLESIAESVDARTPAPTDKASFRTQNRQCTIFAVTDNKKANDDKADLLQRVAQLEQQLKQATQGGCQ